MKKGITISLLFILSVFYVHAQRTKIIEPNVGFLDDMIYADTIATGGKATRVDTSTVYVLKRGFTYYVQGVFENKAWPLKIKAEAGTGAKPIVRPFPMTDGTLNSPLITLSGAGNFENIWFDGEGDGDNATLKPATIMFYSSYEGLKFDLQGCIVANACQAGMQFFKYTVYAKVNNCRFYNMGKMAYSDFGNGRVFDARDTQYGLVSFTNCTFVNSTDRIFRHRNGTVPLDKFVFDHNTVVNNSGFHGFIELGNVGTSVQITNNLMVDCLGLGADPTDITVRLTELDKHGEKDASGNNKWVWVGSVPNPTTKYTISKNIYTISAAQQTWYNSHSLTVGAILTDTISKRLGTGAATAFLKKDLTLPNIPAPPVAFFTFYWAPKPDGAGKTKMTTNVVDYNKMDAAYWLNTLNCKYTISDINFIGTDGIAVGDPSWGSVATNNVGLADRNKSGKGLVSYPNPFTTSTTLKFKTDKYSEVSIDILDQTGKVVKHIAAGSFAPGENTIDIQRENMTNGMYILRMNTDGKTSFSKLIVK